MFMPVLENDTNTQSSKYNGGEALLLREDPREMIDDDPKASVKIYRKAVEQGKDSVSAMSALRKLRRRLNTFSL
jgi:hypothetical protein